MSTPPGSRVPADAELAAVIELWPGLPKAVRAGIVAMVKAANETCPPELALAELQADPCNLLSDVSDAPKLEDMPDAELDALGKTARKEGFTQLVKDIARERKNRKRR